MAKKDLVTRTLNHIKGILTKANQKQYEKAMADLAAEGPEEKAAVDLYLNTLKQGDEAMSRVEKLKSKYSL